MSLRDYERQFVSLNICGRNVKNLHKFTVSDEREEQKCGPQSAREGERRISGARQAAALAQRHHQSAGQGQHHQTHHQLPQDASSVPGG